MWIPKIMFLVDTARVPWLSGQIFCLVRRELIRTEHDSVPDKGIRRILASEITAVPRRDREMKFFFEFTFPLVYLACRNNKQNLAFALLPIPVHDNSRFDAFAKAHPVGKDGSIVIRKA